MTTASSLFPSVELNKLQASETSYTGRSVRRGKMDAFDAETQVKRVELSERQHTHPQDFDGAEKRVRPNTKAAKLRAEIRERLNAPNPHEAAYAEAFGPYEKADLALQAFKRERVLDRITEVTADVEG